MLCYGGVAVEAFIELPYTPQPGIAHIICDEAYRIGGGSGHVAEWLGSWGVPVRLSGYSLGQDRQGDRLWEWLEAYPSIELANLQRLPGIDTLVSRTLPFPDGSRYLLCVGYEHVTLTPPSEQLLEGIGLLEIAFYHRQVRGNAASREMARLAIDKGIALVVMDLLDPRDELVRSGDIISNSAASIAEKYPEVDRLAHCRALQAISHEVVVLTDGNRAIHALDRDGRHYSLLPPQVTMVEATGAGDSFRAGMIYGRLQQWSLPRTLSWATAVSALQVQRSLAQDRPPSKERVMEMAERIEVSEIL